MGKKGGIELIIEIMTLVKLTFLSPWNEVNNPILSKNLAYQRKNKSYFLSKTESAMHRMHN